MSQVQNDSVDHEAELDKGGVPASAPRLPGGGEDDASTEIEGDDSHLHEDQKAPSLKSSS